jgi:GT2 family glycosyltransferase
MLNSDTIVCENWAIKMLDAAMQRPEIGIVGPLSNAAGTQSVPNIKGNGTNTAINTIPEEITYADIDRFLEKTSLANAMPEVSLVHGFCFGIKREVIDAIGFFDSVNFARYYGEENDYCFRAAAAGFRFSIATNTFVFHRKSRSIDEEERIVHMGLAGQRLRELYGVEAIKAACLQGEEHPLLKRMRAQVADFFKNHRK